MALGDVTSTIDNGPYIVELLASATAANGIPSGASAGISCDLIRRQAVQHDAIRVAIKSTAGSATMVVKCTVWLRAGAIWFVAKPLAASSAAPQTPVDIAENSADALNYSEIVTGLGGADRIYLEIVSIGGTSPAITGYALVG